MHVAHGILERKLSNRYQLLYTQAIVVGGQGRTPSFQLVHGVVAGIKGLGSIKLISSKVF